MSYVALLAGGEKQVDVTESASGHFRVVIDGRVFQVDARDTPAGTMSLLCDNQSYQVEAEPNPDGGEVMAIRGHIITVEVVDPRTLRARSIRAAARPPGGPVEVRSPMPGKVLALLVEDGQEVQAGQGVLIVEAMKMENEMKAPRAGTVRKLCVQAGEPVESGAALFILE